MRSQARSRRALAGRLPVEFAREGRGTELVARVPREGLIPLMLVLRDGLDFAQLMDICGVDRPGREPRFDVVYQLLSLTRNARVRVRSPPPTRSHRCPAFR